MLAILLIGSSCKKTTTINNYNEKPKTTEESIQKPGADEIELTVEGDILAINNWQLVDRYESGDFNQRMFRFKAGNKIVILRKVKATAYWQNEVGPKLYTGEAVLKMRE